MSSSNLKVTVIGAGAFGTAMATQAARCGHNVDLYVRNIAQAGYIKEARVNPKVLNEFTLLPNIQAETNLEKALYNTSLIVLAIPAQSCPQWLKEHKHLIDPHTIICNTAKGLYLKERKMLSDAVREAMERDQPYTQMGGIH